MAFCCKCGEEFTKEEKPNPHIKHCPDRWTEWDEWLECLIKKYDYSDSFLVAFYTRYRHKYDTRYRK